MSTSLPSASPSDEGSGVRSSEGEERLVREGTASLIFVIAGMASEVTVEPSGGLCSCLALLLCASGDGLQVGALRAGSAEGMWWLRMGSGRLYGVKCAVYTNYRLD